MSRELIKIDWTKEIEHSQGAVVEYIGRRSQRGGTAITDGCVHLLVCGNDQNATYVDDYGRVPKKRDPKTNEVLQWLTVVSEKKIPPPPPPKPRSPAEAMSDLTSAVDALREVAEKEGVNLRRMLHSHMDALRASTERHVEALAAHGSRAQDDFLAALKLSSEGLHDTIVSAVTQAVSLAVSECLKAAVDAAPPAVLPVPVVAVSRH